MKILPEYRTLGRALDRQNTPVFVSDEEVNSWVASAREADHKFGHEVLFLAFRRMAGYEEMTEHLKAGVSN